MTKGFSFNYENTEEYDEYLAKYKDASFNVKGVLRISWANVLKYDKPIYMVLFLDKSCTNAMLPIYYNKSFRGYQYWWAINNDDNNYALAKTLLGEEGSRRFFSSRFGSLRIGAEGIIYNFGHTSGIGTGVYEGCDEWRCPIYLDFNREDMSGFPTVRFYKPKTIDINSITIAEQGDMDEGDDWRQNPSSNKQSSQCYELDGMFLNTMADDFYVNVRDKPSTKDGKVLARIAAQTSQKYIQVATESDGCDETKAQLFWAAFMTHRTAFLKSNKDVTAPDKFAVFASDILPGDWCKVTVYEQPADSYDMCITISQKPKTVKLVQGYIHCSQLTELYACPI